MSGRRLGAFGALLLALLLPGCKPDAQEHIRRAKDAVFEKRPREALANYLAALNQLARDDSPEAQVLRARVLRGAADLYYLELREIPEAISVYRELIQRCPEAPETLEARIHLAHILRAYGRDLRGAINELTAAIARNPPQSAELNYEVAKLYFELGDYRQCELEAEALAKKYETSAFVDDALLLRAQAISMMEGRRADAARAFQDLVDRFPQSELQPHALFELGKLRAEVGEHERAIEAWVASLERHPDPKVVQDAIARTRSRMLATTPGKIGDSKTAFDRHLVARPAPPPRPRPKPAPEPPPAAPAPSAEAPGTGAESPPPTP